EVVGEGGGDILFFGEIAHGDERILGGFPFFGIAITELIGVPEFNRREQHLELKQRVGIELLAQAGEQIGAAGSNRLAVSVGVFFQECSLFFGGGSQCGFEVVRHGQVFNIGGAKE